MFRHSFCWRLLALVLTLGALSGNSQAADPGIPSRNSVPDPRVYSDQKPGSVLLYDYYTSNPGNLKGENSEFTITNTNSNASVTVHFMFVAWDCSVADALLCLAPNQTTTFLASEVDPGVTGYIVAFAEDSEDGCPISFNHLIGSESIKLASGHTASLGAVAVSALYQGKLPGCNQQTPLATLHFDGVRYNQLPRVLAVDRLRSPADDNAALLIVNSINGNLATGAQPIRNLDGELFNDAGMSYAFTRTCGCGLSAPLNNTFPATQPLFAEVIPAGRTGWLKLKARQELAISGAILNFNAKPTERNTAFTGGHNLQHLELVTASVLVPVFSPYCTEIIK
jgi:hypothetical protein